jgi:putative ABC transport system permease protein
MRLRMLDTIWRDLRYALRRLRARPLLAAAVVVTLALGTGANLAVFGIVDRLLLQSPTYMRDPRSVHMVYLYLTANGVERASYGMQYARYLDLQRWTNSFSASAAWVQRDLAVGAGDETRETPIGVVSPNYFEFFDAPPAVGRYFTTAENALPNAAAVVVLSYATWQSRYAGRREVIGSTLRIGALAYTIIGVTPRGFVPWPERPSAMFIPIASYASNPAAELNIKGTWWTSYDSPNWMVMMVRRRPSVTVDAATADLTRAFQRSYAMQRTDLPNTLPANLAFPHALAGSINEERGPRGPSPVVRAAAWVFAGALIVLLMAFVNVTGLLVGSALERRHEVAVRLALGISRPRLLAQLATEGAVLAFLGGLAGLLLAQLGSAWLRAVLLPGSPPNAVAGSYRLLLFDGGIVLCATIAAGLTPMLQVPSSTLIEDLKAGGRSGMIQRARTREMLMILQFALSAVLLVGAGLSTRSLHKVNTLRLGYDADSLLAVDLKLRGVPMDTVQRSLLRHKLLAAVKSIPGVEQASLELVPPLRSSPGPSLIADGTDVGRMDNVGFNAVSPEHFATLGVRIVRGRSFTNELTSSTPLAMIVSERLADVLWPRKDPLGQCVKVGSEDAQCTHVVGVAEDIRDKLFLHDDPLAFYLPAAQYHEDRGGLMVRTRGKATHYLETVRRRLQEEMPGTAYVTVRAMSASVEASGHSWRMAAIMFSGFGALALFLALIGLYSAVASRVVQQTREFGIRVALGARPIDISRLVIARSLRIAAVALLLGIPAAMAAERWAKPLLFDQTIKDPWIFVLVPVILVAVAVTASWVPARRAGRADPQVALRAE